MALRLWVMGCLLSGFSGTVSGAEMLVHRDIEFSKSGGVSLALDAAIPLSSSPPPAVIVVHGGGWVRGDRETDVRPLFRPLYDNGFAWFSISYRLLHQDLTQFGDAIDDVAAAIRFVKAHAAEYHIDPGRIALVGESAGGQLAAMAALDPSLETRVKAVVAIYTPTDLVSLVRNSAYVPDWIRQSLIGTPWEPLMMARLKQLSPIEHVSRDMPPFLLIHGTADPLVPFEQSRIMCDRMKTAGAICELYPVEGAGHGLRWWEPSPKIAEPYKKEMVRWLKQQLG